MRFGKAPILAALMIIGASSVAFGLDENQATPRLTAEQIVARNVASRGGLEAWRKVRALTFQGTLGAGGDRRSVIPTAESISVKGKIPSDTRLTTEARLPFTLSLQRPRKSRLEIQFKGQSAVQVYDGVNGWKLRPFLNRTDVEPYAPQELKIAAAQPDLDGPLIDYAAKGTRIELDGTETVENRPTYKLKATSKTGQQIHVWVDGQTFLEAKIDGEPRELDGKLHPVEIFYRNYKTVEGLQIPFTIETRVLPVATNSKIAESQIPPEQIEIEKVIVNPKLEATAFSKPQATASAAHTSGQ